MVLSAAVYLEAVCLAVVVGPRVGGAVGGLGLSGWLCVGRGRGESGRAGVMVVLVAVTIARSRCAADRFVSVAFDHPGVRCTTNGRRVAGLGGYRGA